MKNLYFLLAVAALVALAACNTAKNEEKTQAKSENSQTSQRETVPQDIMFEAYLASDQLSDDGQIPVLIAAKNNTDEKIEIGEDDFSIWTEIDGEQHGYQLTADNDIRTETIERQSEGYLYTDMITDLQATQKPLLAEDFNLKYEGEYLDVPVTINLHQEVPESYAGILKEQKQEAEAPIDATDEIAASESIEQPADEQAESTPESINGFIPEDRLKVTAYQMEARNNQLAKAYIRVENLSDEEVHYDATRCFVFDTGEEYSEADLHDDAFDSTMTVPPHGKIDYIDYFQLESKYDEDLDAEDIIKNIYGIHYQDDQFFEVIDIYGNYEEELPSDFSEIE
ncbi:hypothetical protein [Sediminibacillus sp. JSM 1682029]|uniref:hypothetical protein n=1 Tax=Sediminibacillus sp. JSM 1682029 TaxID=3229857 RepID=UPI00047B9CD5